MDFRRNFLLDPNYKQDRIIQDLMKNHKETPQVVFEPDTGRIAIPPELVERAKPIIILGVNNNLDAIAISKLLAKENIPVLCLSLEQKQDIPRFQNIFELTLSKELNDFTEVLDMPVAGKISQGRNKYGRKTTSKETGRTVSGQNARPQAIRAPKRLGHGGR